MMYATYTQLVLKINLVCVCVEKDNDKTNVANHKSC